jgi:Fe-S-cluster-containing dehydrogenase component
MAIKYGMLINLSKCVGCGSCALACKTENNTEHQKGGTKYNWADFLTFTTGTFATKDVGFEARPVLCNHCADPGCVPMCPVNPPAIYKTATNITMVDEARCTGCQLCQDGCPYSSKDVIADGVQYSVLHYNPAPPAVTQSFWDDTTAVISGGTSTPAGVVAAATLKPPYKNAYTHSSYSAVRPSNVVEKCYFCDHRLQQGLLPYCVVSCPAGARVFGDLNDPSSYISTLIASNPWKRLNSNSGAWITPPNTGTDPSVYYIGDFTSNPVAVNEIDDLPVMQLSLYPNPVSNIATIEFELVNDTPVNVTIYDIMGKEVRKVMQKEHKLSGKQKIEINVSDLNAGEYICNVLTNDDVMSANFVVAK